MEKPYGNAVIQDGSAFDGVGFHWQRVIGLGTYKGPKRANTPHKYVPCRFSSAGCFCFCFLRLRYRVIYLIRYDRVMIFIV